MVCATARRWRARPIQVTRRHICGVLDPLITLFVSQASSAASNSPRWRGVARLSSATSAQTSCSANATSPRRGCTGALPRRVACPAPCPTPGPLRLGFLAGHRAATLPHTSPHAIPCNTMQYLAGTGSQSTRPVGQPKKPLVLWRPLTLLGEPPFPLPVCHQQWRLL